MGASFEYRVLRGTEEEVRKRFAELQDNCRYENGHSYSGGIGMLAGVSRKVYQTTTEDSAIDYIEENCEKWGQALICKLDDDIETYVIGGLCSS